MKQEAIAIAKSLKEEEIKKLTKTFLDIKNSFHDEVSLLTKLSGDACQRDPDFETSEQSESTLSKFMVTIKLDFGEGPNEVASGAGQNKPSAKKEACINALRALCPEEYEKWTQRSTVKVVLNPEETKGEFSIDDRLKLREEADISLYSEEQLADFNSEKDAAIDDCTLISTKQNKLCKKYSPSSLLNMLKQKCKDRFKEENIKLTEGGIQKFKVVIMIDGKPKGES